MQRSARRYAASALANVKNGSAEEAIHDIGHVDAALAKLDAFLGAAPRAKETNDG